MSIYITFLIALVCYSQLVFGSLVDRETDGRRCPSNQNCNCYNRNVVLYCHREKPCTGNRVCCETSCCQTTCVVPYNNNNWNNNNNRGNGWGSSNNGWFGNNNGWFGGKK